MKRRFKSVWRDAAVRYIDRQWLGEWRWVSGDTATREQLVTAAMSVYRSYLSMAYSHAISHPRSKKAMDDVLIHSRELARLGRYALELTHDA